MKFFVLWLITCRITYLLIKKGFGEGAFFILFSFQAPCVIVVESLKQRLLPRHHQKRFDVYKGFGFVCFAVDIQLHVGIGVRRGVFKVVEDARPVGRPAQG
jgi:hypothetical protein